jgi:oligopeptide transport system permease protein
MAEITKISQEEWQHVPKENKDKEVILRPSMTYWQDAWRRLKQNILAMIGFYTVILLVLIAVFGPMISKHDFSTQNLNNSGVPPRFEIHQIADDSFVYVHREYKLIEVTGDGEIIGRIREAKKDLKAKKSYYEIAGKEVVLDYTFAAMSDEENLSGKRFDLIVDGTVVEASKKVRNKTYLFGSDTLGRDIFVRVLNGARISLLIAFVATLVNFCIGVLYGGLSGYIGGRVDDIMMRIVDIISVIPLVLYVVLLTVVIGTGLDSIIIAIGSVYWVRMARIVRGQVLSLKEQEYVLAAKTLGASTWRIMLRHLIPNAMGPIIVALTMMIPSAIFTEAFLSFIGLGVSPPVASWGTLANDALTGLRSFGYQLFFPSMAICITMLAFNFLGDGLRDALDPRLRK